MSEQILNIEYLSSKEKICRFIDNIKNEYGLHEYVVAVYRLDGRYIDALIRETVEKIYTCESIGQKIYEVRPVSTMMSAVSSEYFFGGGGIEDYKKQLTSSEFINSSNKRFSVNDSIQYIFSCHYSGPNVHANLSFLIMFCANEKIMEDVMHKINTEIRATRIRNRTIRIFPTGTISVSRKYTWDDICLPPIPLNDIKNNIEFFLKRKDWFIKNKIPYKRGLLLAGPPGNGKTLLCKILLTQYEEFIGYAIDFSHPDTDNTTLRDMFSDASRDAPSIILLEDIDRMFGKKDENSDYARSSVTLDCLLNTIDGAGEYSGVIVVATANDPNILDPALKSRPSRFDRFIKFDNPDPEQRFIFFKKLFGNSFDDDFYHTLSQNTEGFSMGFIKEIYLKSVFDAVGDGVENPTRDHVYNATMVMTEHKKKTADASVGFVAAGRSRNNFLKHL